MNSPVLNIRTPGEGMADDHNIILRIIEFAPCFVRDGRLLQDCTAFEFEGGYDMNVLLDQTGMVVHY